MLGVIIRPGESLDSAVRRFKRMMEKTRVIFEMRRRESHEKPSEQRKRAEAAGFKRLRKRLMRDNPMFLTKMRKVKKVKKVKRKSSD